MRFLHDFLVKREPRAAPARVPEAVHEGAGGRVLLVVPQGAPRRAGEQLPLDPRLQRLRQLAGQRRLGQGARSFYYPPKSQRCVDCHMPMVASNDFGNKHGHRRTRTASPPPTRRCRRRTRTPSSSKATEQFLKDGIVTVDIFAHRPGARARRGGAMVPGGDLVDDLRGRRRRRSRSARRRRRRAGAAGHRAARTAWTPPCAAATLCAWTSSSARARSATSSRAARWTPSTSGSSCRRSTTRARSIFWSGEVEDGGKGPVEKGAHFYRSLQMDAHGNPINKRNAWSTRAVVYVRLIPPGAADTVHYRLQIPETRRRPDHAEGEAELPQVPVVSTRSSRTPA